MKLTREMLKETIDSYSEYMSAEEVFINLVCSTMFKCPQILPGLTQSLGQAYTNILQNYQQTCHLANERAWYLETYLSGNMYSEENAKKPEYIDIQRGHATQIKEATAKALGDK